MCSCLIRKIATAFKVYIRPTLCRIFNTAQYLLTPKDERIVLSVWIRHCGSHVFQNNWGDDINYHFFSLLSGKKIFGYSSLFPWAIRNAENFTCIGSLIDSFCHQNTTVWGSGVLHGDSSLHIKPTRVCAVRGPLSRQFLLDNGVNCPEIYGDPALLLPRIVKCDTEKKYRLGIIPIMSDIHQPVLSKFAEDESVKIIDMTNYGDWHSVIYDICSCEFIVSSSLHGLIVADAYNIPNARIIFNEKSYAGGDFKYHDYFLSVSRDIRKPLSVNQSTTISDLIEECKIWKPISIDLQPLIDACPIKINFSEIKPPKNTIS